MEGSKGFFSVLCFLFVVFIWSAEVNGDDCVKQLKQIITSQLPVKVGEGLMDPFDYKGPGFVYSELKLFHKMIQLFYSTSDSVKEKIKNVFKLNNPNCENLWCESFITFISDLEKDGSIQYKTLIYIQDGNVPHEGLSRCFQPADRITIDFSNRDVSKETISQKYGEYSDRGGSIFLKALLNEGTDFYLFNGLKVSSAIFKSYKSVSSQEEFINLDGKAETVGWKKVTGSFQSGTKTETSCPSVVNLIQTTLDDDKFEMFYFQPSFSTLHTKDTKTECIKAIFSDLRQYVRETRDMKSGRPFGSLAVPHIDFRMDVDFKPHLKEDLGQLFDTYQVTRVYKKDDTLFELRSFEYFYLKEDEDKELPGQIDRRLDSPFVFTLVHKRLNTILKAGAYLRTK